MKILGLDTSGNPCGAVLYENGKLCEELTLPQDLPASKHLLSLIDELLKKCGISLSNLGGIAVTTGPGSFTSLRIGISTVKGLAWTHKLPVAGISTLDALAQRTAPNPYLICPIIDAQQGMVYAAIYRWEKNGLSKISSDLLISPQDLAAELKDEALFIGSGIKKHREELEKLLDKRAVFDENINQPQASIIAQIGFKLIEEGKGISATELTPYYLRQPAAKEKAI